MTSVNITNTDKTKTKTIYTELSIDTLKNLLTSTNNRSNNIILIIKFGATWCRPCKKIKDLCNQCFLEMPKNFLFFDNDFDNNMEIFSAFKAKKMVKGVPTILGYYCKNTRDQWYISDTSVSGSETKSVFEFFKGIYATK